MTLTFDNGNGFKVTSEMNFIRLSATFIGIGISEGVFDEKNREVMARAIAEFIYEFRKNPIYLDTTGYSYIEAKAWQNLIAEGVEFPNDDVLTLFAAILHHYLGLI